MKGLHEAMEPPGSWPSPIKQEQHHVDFDQMPAFSQLLEEENSGIEEERHEQDVVDDVKGSIPSSTMASLPPEIIEQYTSLMLSLDSTNSLIFHCAMD